MKRTRFLSHAPFPSLLPLFLLSLFLSLSLGCMLEDGRGSIYISVFEDLPPGGLIGELPIRGNVTKGGNGLELRLVKGDDIVEIKKGTKQLILKTPLDRDEGSSKLEAIIECTMDEQSNEFTKLNIPVVILVKDVNDNAPRFDKDEYSVAINEELPIGTIVYASFEASDADQSGPNSEIKYSIVDEGEYGDLLTVADEDKPLVSVKKRMDYESSLHNFTVFIEARDNGDPVQRTRVPLRVTVKDVDDLPPRFDTEFHHARMVTNGELVVLPPIHAEDGDALNVPILYELSGELSDNFSIDRDGSVRIRSTPSPPLASLFIHAYQQDNLERNASALLIVDLLPTLQFEHTRYSAQVQADTVSNTLITQVRAVARNEKAVVRYAVEDEKAMVTVDEKSGKVIYMGVEEGKTVPEGSITYTLIANDGKEIARAYLAIDFIHDTPCDGGIRFEHDTYEMQTDATSYVGEISLAPRSQPATMRLLNMNNFFSLDNAGRLSLSSFPPPCDYCELIVSATDNDGRVALSKVIVHNLSTTISLTSILFILLVLSVVLLFSLLVLLICRRISYARRKPTKGVCWITRSKSEEEMAAKENLGKAHCYVINSDTKTTSSPSSTSKSIQSPSSGLPSSPPSRSGTYRNSTSTGARLVPITVTSQDGAPTVYF